jgi:prepilin peptidase CpaA
VTGPFQPVDFWIVIAFLPILCATAVYDLRQMRIPNYLSLAGLFLFALCLPALGLEEWGWRALTGLFTFVLCFGLFAAGWLGGGDAKILPVTVLFVPFGHIELYMLSFSASMVLGMVGIWAVRQRLSHPQTSWVSMQPGAAFPMGISIAASLPMALIAAQFIPL